MSRQNIRDQQLRLQIADHAAKIIHESGIRDFQMAKQKAAAALGIADVHCLPNNRELEQALQAYLRLFDADQAQRLATLRQAAIDAMEFLTEFKPRLVGAVLSGTITRHSIIELHLFCDFTEQVGLFLQHKGIPFDVKERRLRLNLNDYQRYPTIRFIANEIPVELVLFTQDEIRQAPLSQIDGKPMHRATLTEVKKLSGTT